MKLILPSRRDSLPWKDFIDIATCVNCASKRFVSDERHCIVMNIHTFDSGPDPSNAGNLNDQQNITFMREALSNW